MKKKRVYDKILLWKIIILHAWQKNAWQKYPYAMQKWILKKYAQKNTHFFEKFYLPIFCNFLVFVQTSSSCQNISIFNKHTSTNMLIFLWVWFGITGRFWPDFHSGLNWYQPWIFMFKQFWKDMDPIFFGRFLKLPLKKLTNLYRMFSLRIFRLNSKSTF